MPNINDVLIEFCAMQLWLQRGTHFRRRMNDIREGRATNDTWFQETLQRMYMRTWLRHEDCVAWRLYR